jgi:hypothetical protein
MLPDEGEYLTTGWEADLDPTDSLVRQALLAHVSWSRAIADAAGGDSIDEPGWAAGAAGTSPMLNWVLVKQPPSDWAPLVDSIAAFMPDSASALVVSPFTTPDLTTFGLGLVGHPPLMLRPTTQVTAPPSTDLDVRRATSPDELVDAERVLIEGYPLPDLTDLPPGEFYRPGFGGDTTQVFVAYDGDTPVATSAAHSAAGISVIENVAVLSTARGRGAGAAITLAATTAWPDQPAMLIASDDGQPVYERLGYLRLVRWTCWLFRPS